MAGFAVHSPGRKHGEGFFHCSSWKGQKKGKISAIADTDLETHSR